jgi:tetratricopeptide (TPR) repeat protein
MKILSFTTICAVTGAAMLMGNRGADPNASLSRLFEVPGENANIDVRPVGPRPVVMPSASAVSPGSDYRFEGGAQQMVQDQVPEVAPVRIVPPITRSDAVATNRVYVQDSGDATINPLVPRPPQASAVVEETTAAITDPGALLNAGRLVEVAQIASRNRDGALANALAWELFTRNRWEDACIWFDRAVEWGGPRQEAIYGLAMAEYNLGHIGESITHAREVAKESRDARKFLEDVLSVGATEAYDTKNYPAAVRMLRELYQYRYLNRGEQLMLAWSYQHVGRHQDAASLFEALYRNQPDQNTADGLNAALTSLGEIDYRNSLVRELNGPLAKHVEVVDQMPSYSDRLAQRGYIRAAEATRPDDYPQFQSVGDPVVRGGASFRYKSGTDGLGQLSETRLPTVGARVYLLKRHMVEVQASRVVLTTGSPSTSPDVDIGTPPPEPTTPAQIAAREAIKIFPHKPTTEKSDMEVLLRYRWEGLLSPYAEVGFPAGGGGGGYPSFRLGLTSQYDRGYVEGEFFGLPVRESILSYSGIVDPWTGTKWGKVREYGGRFSVYHELNKDYTMYGQIVGSYLNGNGVQNNQKLAMRISGSRNFEVDGFEFLTVGPGISVNSYRRNLGKFTMGHGGYFSPETMFQGDITAMFLTEQGKDWLVRGSTFIGYQSNHQASAPYFPKNPDGRLYPSESKASIVFGISAEGAVLLSPEWILGGQFSMASTANYTEYTLGMMLQYTFGSRTGLFGSDLVGWSNFWGN